MSSRSTAAPRAIPNTLEVKYSTQLSVSNWRTTLFFPAPRAIRVANSLARAAPRERSRLATFVHAMKRTNTTAPNRSHSDARTSRPVT